MTGHIFETAQANRLQGLPDRSRLGGCMQGTQPRQVLFGAEQVFDTRGMTNPEQNPRQFIALFCQGFAVEANLPGGRAHEAGQKA
ncbi:hypothetical protein D3C78_1590650 [compost metagenome]